MVSVLPINNYWQGGKRIVIPTYRQNILFTLSEFITFPLITYYEFIFIQHSAHLVKYVTFLLSTLKN